MTMHTWLVSWTHHIRAKAIARPHRCNDAHRLGNGRPACNIQVARSDVWRQDRRGSSSCHFNVATTQKWVNPMSLLLDDFKGKGHYVTMYSAYMGDIMAQIGREEWKMNMVRTAQSNQTGENVKDVMNKMKVGTYEACFWQHNNKPLVYAAWLDNAILKTLSNHHGALALNTENCLMRRGKDKNGSRDEAEGCDVSRADKRVLQDIPPYR